jgi:lipoprotein-anchoring transpeptidase ErfK/SrfK
MASQADGIDGKIFMRARISITLTFVICLAASCAALDAAVAAVTVRVHLSSETMNVIVDGSEFAVWPVSTARRGYRTPVGTHKPISLQRMHYSRMYHYSPMPYSIFFHTGWAIHGTYETGHLGRPASHGCIRLSPDHARSLFELVEQQGTGNTTIEVVP